MRVDYLFLDTLYRLSEAGILHRFHALRCLQFFPGPVAFPAGAKGSTKEEGLIPMLCQSDHLRAGVPLYHYAVAALLREIGSPGEATSRFGPLKMWSRLFPAGACGQSNNQPCILQQAHGLIGEMDPTRC